ncbi:hypothetical protein T492DRAFT_339366 [Pavlovales sp. CCMP2436]|nr:hypothetical protein T492DRAFT_339366 [Pavlovales sp. CCMP2436]
MAEREERERADSELVRFCCPKCRSQLFTSHCLLEHTPPDAHSQAARFRHQPRGGQAGCTSLFLDPDSLGPSGGAAGLKENLGKLLCAKCSGRIGSLAWQGSRCACGAWVVPAIQVVASKVDARRPLVDGVPLSPSAPLPATAGERDDRAEAVGGYGGATAASMLAPLPLSIRMPRPPTLATPPRAPTPREVEEGGVVKAETSSPAH